MATTVILFTALVAPSEPLLSNIDPPIKALLNLSTLPLLLPRPEEAIPGAFAAVDVVVVADAADADRCLAGTDGSATPTRALNTSRMLALSVLRDRDTEGPPFFEGLAVVCLFWRGGREWREEDGGARRGNGR